MPFWPDLGENTGVLYVHMYSMYVSVWGEGCMCVCMFLCMCAFVCVTLYPCLCGEGLVHIVSRMCVTKCTCELSVQSSKMALMEECSAFRETQEAKMRCSRRCNFQVGGIQHYHYTPA